MSKRHKKNRHDRLPKKSPSAKREFSRASVVFVALAVVVSLGFWWKLKSASIPPRAAPTEANAANPTAAESKPEFEQLKGRWLRIDGGYVVEIKSIAGSGAMDAAYFNPKPIHVARAEASRDGGVTRVFIELRDVNYPGSTYTLTHEPGSDALKGIYYQAVERQRFEVVFERIK